MYVHNFIYLDDIDRINSELECNLYVKYIINSKLGLFESGERNMDNVTCSF